MTTWQSTRRYTEAERHGHSLAAMRRHPLAMDPATVQRLTAASLTQARPTLGTIHDFVLPKPAAPEMPEKATLTLEEAARKYLRTPEPPNGLAKAIAATHGLNYQSLLNKISDLRGQSRFA